MRNKNEKPIFEPVNFDSWVEALIYSHPYQNENEMFKIGDLCKHKQFGYGIVTGFEMYENNKYLRFWTFELVGKYKTRDILVCKSNLKKIS